MFLDKQGRPKGFGIYARGIFELIPEEISTA